MEKVKKNKIKMSNKNNNLIYRNYANVYPTIHTEYMKIKYFRKTIRMYN